MGFVSASQGFRCESDDHNLFLIYIYYYVHMLYVPCFNPSTDVSFLNYGRQVLLGFAAVGQGWAASCLGQTPQLLTHLFELWHILFWSQDLVTWNKNGPRPSMIGAEAQMNWWPESECMEERCGNDWGSVHSSCPWFPLRLCGNCGWILQHGDTAITEDGPEAANTTMDDLEVWEERLNKIFQLEAWPWIRGQLLRLIHLIQQALAREL